MRRQSGVGEGSEQNIPALEQVAKKAAVHIILILRTKYKRFS